MELEEGGGVKEDVLSDSSLIPYIPNSGVAIYIDYLTPTFHIPANIVFTVLRFVLSYLFIELQGRSSDV